VNSHLEAQVADFGQYGPDRVQPLHRQFWHGDGQFLPKTMTVDVLDNKLDYRVKGFIFSTFYEF
jgi:hypothetical protein